MQGWETTVTLSPPLAEELRFWLSNLQAFNGYCIKQKCNFAKIVIFTDASDTGFGGGIITNWISSSPGYVVLEFWGAKQLYIPRIEGYSLHTAGLASLFATQESQSFLW